MSQAGHREGLPLGTRGGLTVQHVFPLDAEYEFRVGRAGGGLFGIQPVGTDDGDATPPSDDTEVLLTDLWSELLNDGGLGVHSHFFKSGGHSLLAIRLITRINKELAVDLPLQALFRNPTPHGMATELRELASPNRLDPSESPS